VKDEETGDDEEDWVRFHALWTQLRVFTGRAAEAAASLLEAEARGQLPAETAARLRSDALEEADDLPGAAAEAVRALDAAREASEPLDPEEVLRAAALLSAAGDDAAADAQLTAALPAIDALAAEEPDPEERKGLEEAAARMRAALEEPRKDGQERLVPLGRKR